MPAHRVGNLGLGAFLAAPQLSTAREAKTLTPTLSRLAGEGVLPLGFIDLAADRERPLARLRERDGVSDCVVGQAVCHGLLSLKMALRMVRSFLATATSATILGFPASRSR